MPNQMNLIPAPNQDIIDYFLIEANEKGRKPGSVYFRLVEMFESGELTLTEDDLIYLQSKLGYKPAWAKMKAQELGLIEGEKPAQSQSSKPFFEGMVELKKVKVIKSKAGKEMAFLDLLSASKIPISAVVFPGDFEEFKPQLIEGIFLVLYGTWETREGDTNLIIKKLTANSEDIPF